MMKYLKLHIVLLFALTLVMGEKESVAQCDTIATLCDAHLTDGFISDGQQYRALLLDDEVAEFHSTFYGGTMYRIAACAGLDDGNLIFKLYDDERNLIFSNEEHLNAPYWDFKVAMTLNTIIEAQLDPVEASSGCAVMLIGFKQ